MKRWKVMTMKLACLAMGLALCGLSGIADSALSAAGYGICGVAYLLFLFCRYRVSLLACLHVCACSMIVLIEIPKDDGIVRLLIAALSAVVIGLSILALYRMIREQ